MADNKFTVSGDQYYAIDGIMHDIKRQLRLKNGSPLDPEKVILSLQKIDEGKFDQQTKNEFLKLISGGESLVLDAVNGKEILKDARDMFSYIDSDFTNYSACEKGLATKATPVLVYEMAKDANFAQIFGFLNTDISKLCFTQHQIKNFVKKYRNWLCADDYGTFFPFKSNNHFFVAHVYVNSDGTLGVHVYRFGYSRVWNAEDRRRVVVPQLA